MTDAPIGLAPAGPDPVAAEPARMSPLSRYFNVFFSPGPVFEDIRRDPRGWWVPILISIVLWSLMASLYVTRFSEFQGEIAASQLKDSTFLKLAPVETQDKIVQAARKNAEVTPTWQMIAQQSSYIPFVTVLIIWFFAFLYSLIALAMGWLGGTRASKIFITFGLVLGIVVVFGICVVVISVAGRQGTPDSPLPPASWTIGVSAILCLGAVVALLWALGRMAREAALGRILGVASYAIAPGTLAAVLGMIIVFLKTPDATPFGELIPSNLGALAGSKGAIGALAGSLDIFTLWTLILASIGLAKVLKRSMGAAAAVVFTPWILWVLCKVAFGAIGSAGS